MRSACLLLVLALGLAADASAARSRKLQQLAEKCHLGCFGDSYEYRAVKRRIATSDAMTLEMCQAKAESSSGAYKLFAVEFGKECWVSKGLARAQSYGPSTACNVSCAGNAAQRCGGWLAIDLYTIGAACPPPPSPNPPRPADYEITMVFANSKSSQCNNTRNALYDVVKGSHAQNLTAVRCSNSSGSGGTSAIQVNVRFGAVEDLNSAVEWALDLNNGASAALHSASSQGCDAQSAGDMMYMLVTNSTRIPGSTVVYDFACPPEGAPAIADGPKKWTYIVASPFMCCAARR